jgi:catechol 2,3-dioxygenase-like lactoylglutathione lyase family enzyme
MKAAAPLSRGVHHLALNTDDMKMTLDFYTRVLGMPLVHALKVPPGLGTGPGNRGNPPFENLRHYFLDAGGDSLVAFFELPKSQPRGDRNALGTMQHVSFAVSENKFNEILQKIKKRDIPYLGPINVGCDTWSMYFYDPNGIRLEFSHQRESEPKVVRRWTQTQAEALEELRTLSSDDAWLRRLVEHLPVSRAARPAGKRQTAPGRRRSSASRTSRAARPSRRPRTARR